MDEDLLDDPAGLLAADGAGLLRALATAGAQVRELAGRGIEAGVARLAGGGPPRSLLLAADPPVAVVGALLDALADRRAGCPVLRLDPEGPLPSWVSAADLVVVAGVAHHRERNLALLADAASRRGAALLGVGRAGGTLEERCTWARAPYVVVPSTHPDHSAWWSLATPVLQLAVDLGLVDVDLVAVATALDAVAEVCRPAAESFLNPAKGLALQLAGGWPVLVADSAATGVVAELVRGSLARLAGQPATVAVLPGAAAEVAAYLTGAQRPVAAERDLFRDPLAETGPALRLVSVSDGDPAGPAGRGALKAIARAAESGGVPVSDLVTDQPHRLPRLAAQAALGGFAAGYLRLGLGLGSRPLEPALDLGPQRDPHRDRSSDLGPSPA